MCAYAQTLRRSRRHSSRFSQGLAGMSLSRRDQSDCVANPGIAGGFPDRHRRSPRKQGVSGRLPGDAQSTRASGRLLGDALNTRVSGEPCDEKHAAQNPPVSPCSVLIVPTTPEMTTRQHPAGHDRAQSGNSRYSAALRSINCSLIATS